MKVRNASIPKPPRKALPGTRVFVLFSLALLATGAVSFLFADLLWRRGWHSGSTILLTLFVPLMFFNTIGALHGIYGFFLRRFGDAQKITELKAYRDQDISGTSTAILFPIYNENAVEVYARLRATYLSLQKTGQLDNFDFFILSDSTKATNWADEELRWMELVKSLDAFGRIHYRRRLWNESKKSGNIRDFLNLLGNRYRYLVVFDADSFMAGKTIVSLVQLMEVHPRVGLIQTPPSAINAESLFGRLQQFANRLYGPLFTTGFNYWAQSFGNYIGHNAIVRTEPFMKYCDLPSLPGKKPFGGQILSHDFVEAALLVKNNWRVWLAYDLEESYEEVPQGLIEYAQRDRRWCQGNLQHTLVLLARGIRGISRVHFVIGIFSFLSGPIWLLFLLAFNAQAFFQRQTGLTEFAVRPKTPFLNVSADQHAMIVFGLSALVLLAPRFLAIFELFIDKQRARQFGGALRASFSAFLELIVSTLQAPIMMLWHTQFVASILMGRSVSWGNQNRQADGTPWGHAVSQLWKHTLIGLLWGTAISLLDRSLLAWFFPVLLGMLLAIPFTVFTSRRTLGQSSKRAGLFLTPEETAPTADIHLLRELISKESPLANLWNCPVDEVARVIANPYLNALHLALLKRDQAAPTTEVALKELAKNQKPLVELRSKALEAGLDKLSAKEKLFVLSDQGSVQWLHRELWRSPMEKLSAPWRAALGEFAQSTINPTQAAT